MTAPAPMPPTTSAREPIKVVGDILLAELGLAAGRVMQEGQKYDIPPDQAGIQITLSYVGPGKQIGGSNSLDDADPPNEVQEASFLHQVQIKLESYDDSARIRKEEVALALGSIVSQQAQGAALIKIARNVAPFQDVSFPEETGFMKSYVTTVAVTALHRKVKKAAVFDASTFEVELTTGDGFKDASPSQPFGGNP